MTSVIEFCNMLSLTLVESLWRASWYGGLVLLLVWLIGKSRIKIPPRGMCWLWRLAFCRLWISSIGFAPVPIPLLPPQEVRVPATPSSPLKSDSAEAAVERANNSSSVERQPDEKPQSLLIRPGACLSAVWCLGVALLMARLISKWFQVHRSVMKSPLFVDSLVEARVEKLCRQMSVARVPDVRLSTEVARPFLYGLFHPTIVLPSLLCDSNSVNELEATLVHEISHIKRHDLAWNWLLAISEIVLFFHPIIWIARHEWRMTQEIATDELTLANSNLGFSTYANSMIRLLEQSPNTACPKFTVAISETYSQLNRRIRAMYAFPQITRRSRFLFAAMFPLIVVLTVVPWGLSHRIAQSADTAEHSILIKCVDEAGKPIAGAEVFQNHVLNREGITGPDIKNKIYATDKEGTAKIVWSGDSIDLRLWASKTNFVKMHAMWAKKFQLDGDQIPDEFTFTLKLGTEIGGIVKDEAGIPIKGVKLIIADQTAEDWSRSRIAALGIRPKRARWLADEDSLVTDDQGRWKLSNVPRDEDFIWTDGDLATESRFRFEIKHPEYNDVNYSDVDQILEGQEINKNKNGRGGVWTNIVTLKSLRDRSAVFVMEKK